MKVAIYIRVSTDKQEGDNQLIQLKEFCKKNEWDIVKEYSDIISGKETSRPAFDSLFIDAHKKLFDVVLFWDLSRFSRSGTLFTLQKLQELKNSGIDWVSYQEPYIRSLGQFSDVIISLIATVAKIEREKISLRTKAGFYVDSEGIRRSVRNNKPIGRKKGIKDKNKRIRRYWKKPKTVPF